MKKEEAALRAVEASKNAEKITEPTTESVGNADNVVEPIAEATSIVDAEPRQEILAPSVPPEQLASHGEAKETVSALVSVAKPSSLVLSQHKASKGRILVSSLFLKLIKKKPRKNTGRSLA